MKSRLLEQVWPHLWHPEGDCCVWHGAYVGSGKHKRPAASLGGKLVRVAREVLSEKLNRPLEKGEFALHKPPCRNGFCVSPDHLYPGNQSQNMMDQPENVRIDKARKAGFASVRKK